MKKAVDRRRSHHRRHVHCRGMKKLLIVGGVGAATTGAAFIAKRFASRSGGADFERWVERMPDNAPPKWVFRNVTAIRENTDRILQLLESERTSAEGS
jgi:hypothetical protein